jgi:hypothetical protein
MNRREAENIIKHECADANGFLVGLRSHRSFDENEFQTLLEALGSLKETIADQKLIDRAIAGCLAFLLLTLAEQLDSFPRTEDERRLIHDAFARSYDLVESILYYKD